MVLTCTRRNLPSIFYLHLEPGHERLAVDNELKACFEEAEESYAEVQKVKANSRKKRELEEYSERVERAYGV